MQGYLGVDIGSISTKAVVLDDNLNIVARSYLWTEGNPIAAVKRVLHEIEERIPDSIGIAAVGTTGSARELVGKVLDAQLIKNEITAHAIGTLSRRHDTRTILEIGGQDSKIVVIRDGVVVDYAMNTLCAAGTGAFLMAQSKRLGIPVEDFGSYALRSKNPTKIAGRCTVFAESDLVHKAQMGHNTEDLVAGLCDAVAHNYLNNVAKGKQLEGPLVFQGGVSKNVGVAHSFEKILKTQVIIDADGHLMGCIGAAILAKKCGVRKLFHFTVQDIQFQTAGIECTGCPNNCEIVYVTRDCDFLDGWGNRCPQGLELARRLHMSRL